MQKDCRASGNKDEERLGTFVGLDGESRREQVGAKLPRRGRDTQRGRGN